MKTLAVAVQKGGAGKSTLAVHLAVEAAHRGLKVILLDLDPQGTLITWGERRGDRQPDIDVEAVHSANLPAVLKRSEREGYDLVVMDTAPTADRTTLTVVKAADLVLMPLQPAQFDLDAIEASIDMVNTCRVPYVVCINAAPARDNSSVVAGAMAVLAEFRAEVAPVVSSRVDFRHCLPGGLTAGEYKPGSKAAAEIAALYDDMVTRLHVTTKETA